MTLRLTGASRVMTGEGSDRPRTLIFRVLRWHDRSDILKGAAAGVSGEVRTEQCHTAVFS